MALESWSKDSLIHAEDRREPMTPDQLNHWLQQLLELQASIRKRRGDDFPDIDIEEELRALRDERLDRLS